MALIFGFLIFAGLGYLLMPVVFSFMHSSYDRHGIEKICDEMFGSTSIMDSLTEEVMIVSYDYNNRTPRIFTKYGARINPELYLTSLSNAS